MDDERHGGDRPSYDDRFEPGFRPSYGRDAEERPGRFAAAAEDEYDFRASGTRPEWAGLGGSSSWREREGREKDSLYARGHGDERRGPGDSRGHNFDDRSAAYDPYADRDLLPPPPPPRAMLAAGRGMEETATAAPAAADSDDEVDLDRIEFEAELARVAAELAKVRSRTVCCNIHAYGVHAFGAVVVKFTAQS